MYGVGLETVTGLKGQLVFVSKEQCPLVELVEAAYSLSDLEAVEGAPSVVVFDISTSVIVGALESGPKN